MDKRTDLRDKLEALEEELATKKEAQTKEVTTDTQDSGKQGGVQGGVPSAGVSGRDAIKWSSGGADRSRIQETVWNLDKVTPGTAIIRDMYKAAVTDKLHSTLGVFTGMGTETVQDLVDLSDAVGMMLLGLTVWMRVTLTVTNDNQGITSERLSQIQQDMVGNMHLPRSESSAWVKRVRDDILTRAGGGSLPLTDEAVRDILGQLRKVRRTDTLPIECMADREYLERGQLGFLPAVAGHLARELKVNVVVRVEAIRATTSTGETILRQWVCAGLKNGAAFWMSNVKGNTLIALLKGFRPGLVWSILMQVVEPRPMEVSPTLGWDLITREWDKQEVAKVKRLNIPDCHLQVSALMKLAGPPLHTNLFPMVELVEIEDYSEYGEEAANSMRLGGTVGAVEGILRWMWSAMGEATGGLGEEALVSVGIASMSQAYERIMVGVKAEAARQRLGMRERITGLSGQTGSGV